MVNVWWNFGGCAWCFLTFLKLDVRWQFQVQCLGCHGFVVAFLIKGCPRSQIFFPSFSIDYYQKWKRIEFVIKTVIVLQFVGLFGPDHNDYEKVVNIDTKFRKSGQSDRLNRGAKKTRCPKRADTYMRWCLRSSSFSEVPRSNEFSTRQSDDWLLDGLYSKPNIFSQAFCSMPVVHVEDPTLHRVVKLGSFEGTKVLLEGKAALFVK